MASDSNLYDDWVEQYEHVYRAPEELLTLSCPNCTSRTLKLVFVVATADEKRATASFWCATCLQGIALAPAEVPPGVEAHLREEVGVPNYSLVLPD